VSEGGGNRGRRGGARGGARAPEKEKKRERDTKPHYRRKSPNGGQFKKDNDGQFRTKAYTTEAVERKMTATEGRRCRSLRCLGG